MPRLTEAMMWGVTPLDQLACRIAFKKLRYDGEFTTQGTTPMLQYPGNGGGQNWNSGAYDPASGYLLAPGLNNPITVVLKPSKQPEHQLTLAPNRSPKSANARPYRSFNEQFMSPFKLGALGLTEVPCLQPPHGQLTAVDLKSRKIVWQIPLALADDVTISTSGRQTQRCWQPGPGRAPHGSRWAGWRSRPRSSSSWRCCRDPWRDWQPGGGRLQRGSVVTGPGAQARRGGARRVSAPGRAR